MTRRPPSSTLFPYPTLSRPRGVGRDRRTAPLQVAERAPPQGQRHEERGAQGDPRPGEKCGRQDRKSTRLNSSHLVISYAVFCLKKKNTNTNTLRCSLPEHSR